MNTIISFIPQFQSLSAEGLDLGIVPELYGAAERGVHQLLSSEHALLIGVGAAGLFTVLVFLVALLGRKSGQLLSEGEASDVLERLASLEGFLRDQKTTSGGTNSLVRGEIGYLKQELSAIRESIQQLNQHLTSIERSVLLAPSIARAERRTTDSQLQRFTHTDARDLRDPALLIRTGNGEV